MNYTIILIIISLSLAAVFAWRYIKLRRDINEYASHVRGQNSNT